MSKISNVGLATCAALALMSAPAFAHVTANPNEAPADNYFKTDFRVGHGCEGSPTTEVSVQIPSGVTSVHPQVKPGWEIETEIGELEEPVELHGETITEGVRSITWRSIEDGLPDEYMDDFGVSMRLPAEAEDDVLWFPFVQRCDDGQHRWVTIPESLDAWGETDEPAPYIQLAAGGGGHGGDSDEVEADQATPTAATDDGDNGALLGGLGLGLGAIALVLSLLAWRRTSGTA